MATVTKFANANAVVTTGYTNPTNAYADDSVYATAAPGKNGVVNSDYGFPAFTTSDIPAGSTIDSVTAEIQFKVSTTSSIATQDLQLNNNGTLLGSMQTDATEPTTDKLLTHQVTTGISQSDLQTANFIKARVGSQRANSNTAVTFSLDYVKLTVAYTVASPVSVTPGVDALTMATFAPVVGTSDNQTVTPSVDALAISTFAPTARLSANQKISPGASSLTLAGLAPAIDVTADQTVIPDAASINLSAVAPSITSGLKIIPGAAALTSADFAPMVTATANQTVTPNVGALSLSTFAPITGIGVRISPITGSLSLSGLTPAVMKTANVAVIPDAGVFALAGVTPTVAIGGGDAVAMVDRLALILVTFAPQVNSTVTRHRVFYESIGPARAVTSYRNATWDSTGGRLHLDSQEPRGST